MKMSRRTVIKLGVVGAGAASLAVGKAWVFQDQIKELTPGEVARYLQSHFHYLRLRISNQDLRQFAIEYRKHYGPLHRVSWQRLRGWPEEMIQRQRDDLATRFLMSTDFFLHGGDERREINYVQFYHPYVSPCWNPLSAKVS